MKTRQSLNLDEQECLACINRLLELETDIRAACRAVGFSPEEPRQALLHLTKEIVALRGQIRRLQARFADPSGRW